MTVTIGINGFGRIGRCTLSHISQSMRDDIEVIKVNATGPLDTAAHLIKYDSVHGRYPLDVTVGDKTLDLGRGPMQMFSTYKMEELDWSGCDVVLECTGNFNDGLKANKHIEQGAKKVLLSAPGTNVDKTIVFGVNHNILTADDQIISNASCTTNCLAPLVKPLHEAIGVESGLMTTVHAYTNDQVLTDVYHSDLRRARSATQSMIPTKTGAAAAVGLVLPELNGKLDGFSMRVPTINVSMVDLTFTASRATTVEEINGILKAASEGELKGVLGYTNEPLVSMDFNHDPASSTYDESMTKVGANGTLVKVCAWYDNEWGFSNRMLDTTLALMNA